MAVRIWAEAEALRLAEEIDLLVKKFGLNRGDTAIGLAGGIVYLVAGKGWQDFVRTVRYDLDRMYAIRTEQEDEDNQKPLN